MGQFCNGFPELAGETMVVEIGVGNQPDVSS